MAKAIVSATLEVMWPIPKDKNFSTTIRKISELVRAQNPRKQVWIHAIHVGNQTHVGRIYVDGHHRVLIKGHHNLHHLRKDHLEILFIVKEQ